MTLSLLAGAFLGACGGSAASPVPTVELAPVHASVCREGVVIDASKTEDRTAPRRVRLDGAPEMRARGPALETLGSLPVDPTTRVRVCGNRRIDPEGGAVFEVESLRLISIGEDPAFSGVLLGGGGMWRLQPTTAAEGSDPIPLREVHVPLAPWWGERVWVSGPMREDGLVVRRIGSFEPTPPDGDFGPDGDRSRAPTS